MSDDLIEKKGFKTLCGMAATFPTTDGGFHVERGQLVISVRRLADAAGCSKSTAQRWLARWRDAGMLTMQRGLECRTVVTIKPALFAHVRPFKKDECDRLADTIRSRIGLPPQRATVLEKSLIRRWRYAWELPDDVILEVAERATPEILMKVSVIRSLDVFNEYLEATYAQD